MKYVSDKTARALARGIGNLKFKTDWSSMHTEARAGKDDLKAPRCVPYYRNSKWTIRMSHRGKLFDIAFTDSIGNARRLSDMVLMKVWPYRVRSYSNVIPPELFNFNQKCAELDMENEPEISDALDEVIKRLVEVGAITPLAQIAEAREAFQKKNNLPTVREVLAGIYQRLDQMDASHTTQLIHTRELTKSTANATNLMDTAVNNLHEQLGKQIDSCKEATGALAARVINVQQNIGTLTNTHRDEMQALQSRLVMLEGKIQQQGEWLSDFSKRNMALDAKMGTVVQLLNAIVARLPQSAPAAQAPAAATAVVKEDKINL